MVVVVAAVMVDKMEGEEVIRTIKLYFLTQAPAETRGQEENRKKESNRKRGDTA